ncbi:MAG: restriction endonuclease subunit S [Butyrivibrio sp.]|nr:restriction endonuclease subunit S [Butyrivibrio sp.]
MGDIAEFINGRAYSQDELLSEGKYKVLRVGNFYTNDSWYFSDLELEQKYYADDGDLLYTWSATFGPHIWSGGKVIYHYHIWKVILSDALEKCFAVQLLEHDKANIMSDKNGSTMVHITKAGMEQKLVYLPADITEQEKIGSFLDNIDNLITLHQRDKYISLCRKLYIHYFYPCSWEQRKLEDIASLITKGTTPKDKSGDGEINFIKVENIDSLSGEIKDCSKISIEEHEGYLKRSQLKENDILFSIAGTLGRTTIVNKRFLPANTNQALAILRMSEGDISYIVTVLKGRSVSDFVRRNPTIGAQPNLSLEQVSNLEIPYPNIEEQVKIGEFFSDINNLITLHQRKLLYNIFHGNSVSSLRSLRDCRIIPCRERN